MAENDILEDLLNTYAPVPAQEDEAREGEVPAEQQAVEQAATEETQVPAEDAEEAVVGQEDDADMKVMEEPTEASEDFPDPFAELAAEETPEVPAEFPTRMFSLDEEEAPAEQMTMEDFTAVETSEQTEEEEEAAPSWEEQLEETRKEQIRDFQIRMNSEETDFRYEGGEAPDEAPEQTAFEEVVGEKQPPFEGDYTSPGQKGAVAKELFTRYRSFRFRVLLSIVPLLLLLWSEITIEIYGQPTIMPVLFLLFNVAALTAMGLLFLPMLRDGVQAIARRKLTVDTVPACVFAVSWLHTVLLVFQLPAVETGEAKLLAAAAAMLLLLCGLGRMCRNARILQNFNFVSRDGEKQAADLIEDERTAIEIGRRAVVTGVPRVAYFRTVNFLDDFMANSYIRDRYDEVLQRYIPCAAAVSFVAAVVSAVCSGDFWNFFYTLAATVCVTLPAASLALGLPLYRECKHQLKNGNMVCGYAAAERFGSLHGVAIDVSDVYLKDSVMLHGMRLFGNTRIDEALTDAAAVAIRSDGPLCGLFLRVIEEKTEILPPVENLVFEQDMGFSGWVGGHRVLVGNRKLLENHGVDTPSGDYERKYKKDGRELVYLSVAGELSAMFIISYVTDPAIAEALHDLQDAGISLLIRSLDPNITEDSLCVGFALSDYYVDLLTASAGRLYDRLRRDEEEKASAGAAVGNSVMNKATLLCGCKRLRRRGLAAMITQMVCGGIGGLLCFAAAAAGGVLSAFTLLLLVLVAALISIISGVF